MTEEQIRIEFDKYRKDSDPFIAISDEQANWVLEFIYNVEAARGLSPSESRQEP